MKGNYKLILLGGTALVGIIALILGNGILSNTAVLNDSSVYNNYPTTEQKNIAGPTIDSPQKHTFQYLPTQYLGDQVVKHQYYTLSYSSAHKNAEWVAYELKASLLKSEKSVARGSFVQDPAMRDDAHAKDYHGSGYDRGHLVPASDMSFNELAMKEAGYMSNICPQNPTFNRGIWKSLESKTRAWAKQNKRLYVVVGPILRHNIEDAEHLKGDKKMPTIPRGYYKVILDYDGKEKKGIGFLFENKGIEQPLANFVVSIDRVEDYTGINFFPKLNEQEEVLLEATVNPQEWGF